MIPKLEKLIKEVSKYIVGYEEIVKALFVALICKGHVLLEGPPGIAKTSLVKLFSRLINAKFRRIQFTPDLLPSDIIGTTIYDLRGATFKVRLGPIFTNILLADEINRAPPKTQSALLEAMEERQVTIEGVTYRLEEPFMVIATQNPIEQEGTYPLPEAQLDRFLFKIDLNYPNKTDELRILERKLKTGGKIEPILSKEDVLRYSEMLKNVFISPAAKKYIVDIVCSVRERPEVVWGPSPRASIALMNVSRALALIEGRNFVKPSDVNKYAVWILQHRIGIKPEYETEGISNKDIIIDVLSKVDAP